MRRNVRASRAARIPASTRTGAAAPSFSAASWPWSSPPSPAWRSGSATSRKIWRPPPRSRRRRRPPTPAKPTNGSAVRLRRPQRAGCTPRGRRRPARGVLRGGSRLAIDSQGADGPRGLASGGCERRAGTAARYGRQRQYRDSGCRSDHEDGSAPQSRFDAARISHGRVVLHDPQRRQRARDPRCRPAAVQGRGSRARNASSRDCRCRSAKIFS